MRFGDNLEAEAAVVDLFGAGIQYCSEDVVFRHSVDLFDADDTLAAEVVGDAAGVTHGAAVAGHDRSDICCCTVLVVGQALDQERYSPGRVALVNDGLVVDRDTELARATLDRGVDVRIGNRGLLGLLNGVNERRVAREVGAAHLGRDLDVLDQLGEGLRATLVLDRLLMLGSRPFGVA